MRARVATIAFCAGWLGVLALTLKVGATSYGVTPEQLLPLIVACYLGTWGLIFFLSRRTRVGDAARFVACTGSILLVIALAEVPTCLGLLDYRAVFSIPIPPWRRAGNRPDAELIYVREGNRHARWTCLGGELYGLRGAVPWTTYHCDLGLDQDGFRNLPGLDSADVTVIGDSFIEGVQVADPELVTSHLARLTGRTVANLGRVGYGPQHELAVLRRYALARRPRTCVWAFYEGNDLQDVDAYDANQKDLHRILDGRRADSLYARSLVRNALAFAIRNWLRPEPRRPARRFTGQFVDRSGRPVPMYFATGIQHGEGGPAPPRTDAPELARVRSILAEADALCRRNGVELVVAFLPSKFRVYRDVCAFEPDSPCRSWPVDELPRALETAVASISPAIKFLDLTPGFRAEAGAGTLLYLPDDPHWSAEGHRVAARVLAEYLQSLPATGGSKLAVRPTPKSSDTTVE
jgi:hypothetical protein